MADLADAVSGCMKCGFCKAVCPVFIGEETTSPRAKVRLARAVASGDLDLTQGVEQQMSRCINCRACAVECPSGVEPNRIALEMRRELVDRDGLPLLKHLIFHGGLSHPRLLALASRAMGVAQHVSAIELQNNPLRNLLPLIGMRKDKDLPVMGRRSLMSILPETIDPVGDHKTTVLYFPGCATNLLYPEVGLAAVSVMRKLGARVILPHDLVCCSTPVFNSGDFAGARELAARNLKTFTEVDPEMIVTSCGSCGLTISREWSEMLGITQAESVAGRVVDISQFVARYAPDGALLRLESEQTVTYHDSCHLRRGMGVYEEPRQLLDAILPDGLNEMESADRCCGGGGAFSIYHPGLSQEVAEVKMQCVQASGAQIVASGCPACMMQLRDSFVHRGMPQRATHTVEFIDRALQSGE